MQYIQGQYLQRDVYFKPAEQFNLPHDTYLKLRKPFYGLSESGDSWFNKIKEFLRKELKLQTTYGDLSFHYKKDDKGKLKGTMGVYIDDMLASGDLDLRNLQKRF